MEKRESLKAELRKLAAQGDLLYYAMAAELGQLTKELEADLAANGIRLPRFDKKYDSWYSIALRVVKQVLPDRLNDFVVLYRNDKRKDIDAATYTISDYLSGLQKSYGAIVLAERSAALPKLNQQISIVKSVEVAFESSIVDLRKVLQADLFDSELKAAAALTEQGFLRAGGSMAGVVLERHLTAICDTHGLKQRKKYPQINDLNQALKDNGIIDTAVWRFIQRMGDLRNLCAHRKDREPTREDVRDLLAGVEKVTKTVQ